MQSFGELNNLYMYIYRKIFVHIVDQKPCPLSEVPLHY